MYSELKVRETVAAASQELARATGIHRHKFNSAHEGYAVILEELDELWDEVKKNGQTRDMQKMRDEAIQVAAMAMRFVIDVCGGP
jgi:NTP pyrophosphatase (non-canonical NTP hydrolase)